MKVIGISGLPGSGKNLISTKASEKGFIVVNMGDCVREESLKRNEDSRVTAVKLREEYGLEVVKHFGSKYHHMESEQNKENGEKTTMSLLQMVVLYSIMKKKLSNKKRIIKVC